MHTAQQLLALARQGKGDSVQLAIAIEETTLQRDMLYAALSRLTIVAKGAGWLRRPGDAVEGAESALDFSQKVGTPEERSFAPYRPSNAGDGPIDNAGRDIGHRLHGNGAPAIVTPTTVAMVAWLIQWGHLKKHEEEAILKGLDLEWHEERMGGWTLRPIKQEA